MVFDQQKHVILLPEMCLQIFLIIERFFAENAIVILRCTHDSITVKSLFLNAYSAILFDDYFFLYKAPRQEIICTL